MGNGGRWTTTTISILTTMALGCQEPAADARDPSRYATDHATVDTRVRCIVGEPLELLPGDANRDEVVTWEDVATMIDWLYHGGPRPNLEASDVTGDGEASLEDAIAVYRHVEAGETLPSGEARRPSCQQDLADARREPEPGEMACVTPDTPVLVMADDIAGSPGAAVVASHTSGCDSVLSWDGAYGARAVIDGTPRAYVSAAAGAGEGGVWVCASVADTSPTSMRTESDAPILRVDDVAIHCATAPDPTGPWSAMRELPVPRDGAAASGPAFEWIRDSRYHLSDLRRDGRPATDGFWQTELSLDPTGVTAVRSSQTEAMPFGMDRGPAADMVDSMVDVD